MKIRFRCPYCGSQNSADINAEVEETPIKGSITEFCSSCGVEVDLIRLALLKYFEIESKEVDYGEGT